MTTKKSKQQLVAESSKELVAWFQKWEKHLQPTYLVGVLETIKIHQHLQRDKELDRQEGIENGVVC